MEKTPLQELTENIQLSIATADVSGQSGIQEKINAELKQQLDASQDVDQLEKLSEEHETVERHILANQEQFSSNMRLSYEVTKEIFITLLTSEESATESEHKYESLESRAAQTKEYNQKIQSKIQRIKDLLRLLETGKNIISEIASLNESLDEKIKERSALAALCEK